jgi:biotin carboxyl carrier protein
MAELEIVARVDELSGDGGGYLVRSPSVGTVDSVPALGLYLNPMAPFLTLRVLGRRHPLLLPRGVQGRVAEQLVSGRHIPVEHNQPLLRLRAGLEVTEEERQQAAAARVEADLIPVPSPSDGIFYRRPSPESPPYAEVGQTVSKGSVLGLVEVMKSFNQIVYGSPGLPERGTVQKVLVEDAVEVRFGQPLFMIRPEG